MNDPHPVFKRLREEAPVHYHASLDAWTVARHADVVAATPSAWMPWNYRDALAAAALDSG